jgi:hypothetical protein
MTVVLYSGILREMGLTPHPLLKCQSFDKAEPNPQFHGKYLPNNLIRTSEHGFRAFANLVEPLTRVLLPPDPHSIYPLSSTEFVEPPPPQKKKKILGAPLVP